MNRPQYNYSHIHHRYRFHMHWLCCMDADVLERGTCPDIRHCQLYRFRNRHLSSTPASTTNANSGLLGNTTDKESQYVCFHFCTFMTSLLCCLECSWFWLSDIWFGVLIKTRAGKALQSVDVPSNAWSKLLKKINTSAVKL